MASTDLLPFAGAGCLIIFAFYKVFTTPAATDNEDFHKSSWMFPAALSALFLAYSAIAILNEGPLGFWTEHTRNLWGNQIWFDLLLAIGVGWTLIVGPARALGMKLIPWLFLILCTGSIGVLAMVARFLYLRARA